MSQFDFFWVFLTFTLEGWRQLDPTQRTLSQEVMLDTFGLLVLLDEGSPLLHSGDLQLPSFSRLCPGLSVQEDAIWKKPPFLPAVLPMF